MKDTRVPESTCPYCRAPLDGATSFEEATPSPGDFSVCIQCASLLVFDEAMKLRKCKPAEHDELPDDFKKELALYQRAVRSIDRRPKAERETG